MIHYFDISEELLTEIVALMKNEVFDTWLIPLNFYLQKSGSQTGLGIQLDDSLLEEKVMDIAHAFILGYASGKGIRLYSED
jgi:hypothetical protein